MNSLYTLALRQSSSLNSDLQQLESLYSTPHSSTPAATSALNGQINASLAALDRTIDDYDNMARREIVDLKREKAMQRVAKFKDEYAGLRREYDRVKQQGNQQKTTQDRSELFSASSASTSSLASHSYGASTSSRSIRPNQQQQQQNPYASQQQPYPPPSSSHPSHASANPFGSPDVSIPMGGMSDFHSSVHNNARTNYALRENDFMQQTGATLDAYLAQGQAVLGNLANQRDVMKGTQRRLLSAANTLGLSRETISFIERRTKADYYILLGGGALTLVGFYLILKYFG